MYQRKTVSNWYSRIYENRYEAPFQQKLELGLNHVEANFKLKLTVRCTMLPEFVFAYVPLQRIN